MAVDVQHVWKIMSIIYMVKFELSNYASLKIKI